MELISIDDGSAGDNVILVVAVLHVIGNAKKKFGNLHCKFIKKMNAE